MRKVVVVLVLLLLGLLGWTAAGPYLAIRGISQAIEQRDTGRLERHVDFPTLRMNLKAQLADQVVRRAGVDAQSSMFGAVAISLAGNLAGAGVDAMVTPTGIAALLQGHALWKRASGQTIGGDSYAPTEPAQPLKDASHRFESLSRFTATVHSDDGQPLVFVLDRQGLQWRLTDIRLPLDAG